MVFPVGAGNDYRDASGSQSIENATAELKAGNHPDMRLWFVPSPKAGYIAIDPNSTRGKQKYIQAMDNRVYVGVNDSPQTNLTGGCNTTNMCTNLFDKKKGECRNECHSDDDDLAHDWIPISTESLGPLSAVCYIAVRNVKAGATPNRPVGIIASYVGGTPVGCWANDPKADDTCHVTHSDVKAVPCNPTDHCCPGKLYNDKISPLLPFGSRAVLWYQVYDGVADAASS
jgi:hypothetical protein